MKGAEDEDRKQSIFDEFEASGRMLLNAAADHYLSVEDAVTAGSLILEELIQKLSCV